MIRMAPPEDPDPLLRAAASPEQFDWIVFTSANAVDAFMTALLDGERDVRALKGPRICTSGTATADKLARYGIKVDLIPREFRGDAVAAALIAQGRWPAYGCCCHDPILDVKWLPSSSGKREPTSRKWSVPHDPRGRRSAKAIRTSTECCSKEELMWSTFTSPSAIRNFAKIHGAEQVADLLKHTVVATIGPGDCRCGATARCPRDHPAEDLHDSGAR